MNTEPFIITIQPGIPPRVHAKIPTKLHTIQFDVMLGDLFITTMRMLRNPEKEIDTYDVVQYVYAKRPSLKYTDEIMRLYLDKL